MNKMDLHILAIRTSDVETSLTEALANGGFRAFSTPDEYEKILTASSTSRRGDLETDPTYKQIIPYMVLKLGDKVFYYVRAVGGSETRLHNKLSIGVGGHVDIEDIESADETIRTALLREGREEIGEGVPISNLKPIGFIYTEATEVDAVHLGILFVGELSDDNLTVREKEIGTHGFATRAEITSMIDSADYTAENWTKIAWKMASDLIL